MTFIRGTREMGRASLAWATRIGLVAAMVTAGLVATQAPASAHSTSICSSMSMGAVEELRLGAVRQLTNTSHNHDIRWDIGHTGCGASNFPNGGILRVRVRFIQKNSSGGCTNPPVALFDGDLRIYTGNQVMTLATNVLPTTCYRLIWRPTTANLANRTIFGAIILLQS
ncbi:MAG TPA: hypothetical protein VFC19_12305 [Candidatus Limnocylindrales bacterium]|nr:hypothetical protein [Candidatus Limnocylindrales bacterium]